MRELLLGLCLIVLVPAFSISAENAGTQPAMEKIPLKHQSAKQVIALVWGDRISAAEQGHYSLGERDIAPPGVSYFGVEENGCLAVMGRPRALTALRKGVAVLDVPTGRQVVLQMPTAEEVRRIRASVLAIPGAGKCSVKGQRLILKGSRAWVWNAMRLVAGVVMGTVPQPTAPLAERHEGAHR